ncbi:MAG: FAD-dependent oxidoreductase, partial [Desulfobulbaceae bacterium]|nr:FAD-dependent oxidoreductase [Desulfobulbaceae bacterium]
MDKKYSAYICTGCGIGEAMDIEALAALTKSEGGIECKTHASLCGAEGLALIKGDIDGGANSVVIGACSPRVMTDVFNFGDDKIVVRANLREQVAWCQGPEPKADYVQELASDYMRMACVRIKKTELPEPFQLESINKKILVIGGGVAGLTAAKEAALAGYQVTIIEATDKLGGKAVNWRKQFPSKAPWTDLEEPTVPAMVKDVE